MESRASASGGGAGMTVPEMITPIKPVNREAEVEDFRSALDRIRVLGSVFQTLYEWHGAPGIGKSTLVRLLKEECDRIQIPYSFVDFDEKRNSRVNVYKEDISALIEDLSSGFLGNEEGEVQDAISQYRKAQSKDKERKLDDVARAFQRLIKKWTDKGPAVLFFDETERADQDNVVAWLEEWIVNPLVQNGRCLIVWTGRRPQRWKRFEVRRRARVQELGVFDEEGTRKLFKNNSSYPISDLAVPVRVLTGGHPYADTIVLRYLDYMAKEGRKPVKEQFDQIEPDLLNELIQRFVDSFAFKDLDVEMVRACRMMSLVRQFDVIMLREILTKALPADFGNYGRNEFGDLLSRLRSTQLVLWDDRRKGYAIDPTLRHILGEYIRRDNPELYVQVNLYAIEVYRDWITRAGDNRGIYIVEELYQQACANRILKDTSSKEQIKLANLLRQRITEYHQNDSDLHAAALDRLYHELENDPDLPQLIGDEGLSQLLEIVQVARVHVYQPSE
jgi:hypothetical protein